MKTKALVKRKVKENQKENQKVVTEIPPPTNFPPHANMAKEKENLLATKEIEK